MDKTLISTKPLTHFHSAFSSQVREGDEMRADRELPSTCKWAIFFEFLCDTNKLTQPSSFRIPIHTSRRETPHLSKKTYRFEEIREMTPSNKRLERFIEVWHTNKSLSYILHFYWWINYVQKGIIFQYTCGWKYKQIDLIVILYFNNNSI